MTLWKKGGKLILKDCPECPCGDDGGGGGEHPCASCPSGAPAQVRLTLSNFVRNPIAGGFCPPHDAESDDCSNCLDWEGEYVLDFVGSFPDGTCFYSLEIDWTCSPNCEGVDASFSEVQVRLSRASGTEVQALFILYTSDGLPVSFPASSSVAESPALSCLGWSASGHHVNGSFPADFGAVTKCLYDFDWNIVPLAV